MGTISVCMIVKNEEATLARCLSCLRGIADEIVIVDTGSTDKTKQEAAQFTDQIYDFEWIDDFSAARNFAFSKATMDYTMWLDADDIIRFPERVKLMALKPRLDGSVGAVMMKYNTGFDEKGKVTFSYYRERIVRTNAGSLWVEPVHEYLQMHGKIITEDIAITHAQTAPRMPGRNLSIYEKQLMQGKSLSPRGLYYYARELRDAGRHEDAASWFRRFLDEGGGWVEDNINACVELAGCLAAAGEEAAVLPALLRSFEYDAPRAEGCCQIGYYFKERGELKKALFWFGLALNLQKPQDSIGFIRHDMWDFIPSLESAVCYFHLGDLQKAQEYNEKAAQYKPDSDVVKHNRAFFSHILKEKTPTREESSGRLYEIGHNCQC